MAHVGLVFVASHCPSVRDPIYGNRQRALEKRLALEKNPSAKLMLVMGTSRAGNAFHAQRMERMLRDETGEAVVVYNFAVPGEGPITQQLYLRRLLEKGIRPDLLIIEVVHLQYFDSGQPAEDLTMVPDRVLPREVDLVRGYGVALKGHHDSWRHLRWNPFFELRNSVLSRFGDRLALKDACERWNRDSDAWGWRPITEPQPGWLDYDANLEVARQSFQYLIRNFTPQESSVRALHDTLALCEKNGIDVMLVQLPESSEFRSWYTPESRQNLTNLFESTARAYRIKWFDANAWVPDGNYADGHHLLSDGATKFSDRFVQEAAGPWLMSFRVK